MRQRSVKRVSVRSDEKMQLFDDQGRLLGAGAALSGEVIAGLLSQIAPSSLDGTPISFPYSGRDGQFEVSIKDGGKDFDLHALSFAHSAPLQTHSQPQTQSVTVADSTFTVPDVAPASAPATAPVAAPALLAEWFYLSGAEQVGNNSPDQIRALIAGGQISPDTQMWTAGMADWLPASQTEFAPFLPDPSAASASGHTSGAAFEKPRTYGNGPYNIYGSGDDDNTSGTGEDAEVPLEARGLFNVGAALFPSLWCYCMGLESWGRAIFFFNIIWWRMPWMLFPFFLLLKVLACLYLGVCGNRLGWQHRRFTSVQDFKKCQFLWATVSAGVTAFLALAIVLIMMWAQGQANIYNATLHSGSSSSSTIPPGNGKPFGNLPGADPSVPSPAPGTP